MGLPLSDDSQVEMASDQDCVFPILDPLPNGLFSLRVPFAYEWLENGKECRILVNEGFITDIASVPRWFWVLSFTPDGLWRAAAVIHDALYLHEGELRPDSAYSKNNAHYQEQDPTTKEWVTKTRKFSRKECDDKFKEIMLSCGTSNAKATIMWLAVRGFGWMHW